MNLRAAIYARRSKEEDKSGAGVESVPRQIEFARRAVASLGWSLNERHIVSDEVSGGEILRRPGLQALRVMAGYGEFDVIVVRDLDRFARCEPARQAGLLQELADVDVRLWEYQSREFVRLDGPNFIVTSARMISAEQEKLKASTRIREALHLRAEQGFAVGRAIFGFDHRRDGRIVHRVRNEAEIATIVHVGQTAVRLGSFNGAATALNAEGVLAPAGGAWDARAVKAILTQPIYRGEIIYGRTRSVSKRGTNLRVPAAEEFIQRHARPELAIWPAELQQKIDALVAGRTRNHSPLAKRTHLASGFVKCGLCGTGIVSTGSHVSNSVTYCCDRMRARRCPGIGYRSERAVDEAVLAALAPLVTDEVLERACGIARERLAARRHEDARATEIERLRRELATAERRCRNIGDALAEADAAQRADLMARHREEVQRREAVRAALANTERATPNVDAETLVGQLQARVKALRDLLVQGGADARRAVEAILGQARFIATPVVVDGKKRWDLRARLGGGYLYQAAGASSLPSLCAPLKSLIKGTMGVPVAPANPAITPAGASPAGQPAMPTAPAAAPQPVTPTAPAVAPQPVTLTAPAVAPQPVTLTAPAVAPQVQTQTVNGASAPATAAFANGASGH
jgi:site-specific DNA recombinase